MAYSSCGCGPTRKRHSTRVVYGCASPCFSLKIGEIVDVTIDMSDEFRHDSQIISAAPVPKFVSMISGGTSIGMLGTSIIPPDRSSVDVIINAQDMDLVAGEVWQINTSITMSDGRTFVRCFKVRLLECEARCGTAACAPHTHPVPDPVPSCGVIISGAGGARPNVSVPGLFHLTLPFGATWANVQFHTGGVYTLNGMTPNDITSIGTQVPAGTQITLQNMNELMGFRFTGINGGTAPVQTYVEFYTANPNC